MANFATSANSREMMWGEEWQETEWKKFIFDVTYEKDFIYNNRGNNSCGMRHDRQATEWQKETGEGRDDKQGGVQPRLQDKRTDGSPN